MSDGLLYDIATGFEDAAVMTLATLFGDRATAREAGVHPPPQQGETVSAPWVDIQVREQDSDGNPLNRQEVTLETTITVEVTADTWKAADRMADWAMNLARNALMGDPALGKLFARIQGQQPRHAYGDPGVIPNKAQQVTIRSLFSHREPAGLVTGIIRDLNADQCEDDESRGRVALTTNARVVAWESLGVKLAPHAPTVLYVGAQAGDFLVVRDQGGNVVQNVAAPVIPAATVTLAALNAGVYSVSLDTATSRYPLQVTAAP